MSTLSKTLFSHSLPFLKTKSLSFLRLFFNLIDRRPEWAFQSLQFSLNEAEKSIWERKQRQTNGSVDFGRWSWAPAPLAPQPIVPLLLLLLLLLIIPCNHFSSDNEKEKGEVMILLFGGKVAGYSSTGCWGPSYVTRKNGSVWRNPQTTTTISLAKYLPETSTIIVILEIQPIRPIRSVLKSPQDSGAWYSSVKGNYLTSKSKRPIF